MRKITILLTMILLLVGCQPKEMPVTITDQGYEVEKIISLSYTDNGSFSFWLDGDIFAAAGYFTYNNHKIIKVNLNTKEIEEEKIVYDDNPYFEVRPEGIPEDAHICYRDNDYLIYYVFEYATDSEGSMYTVDSFYLWRDGDSKKLVNIDSLGSEFFTNGYNSIFYLTEEGPHIMNCDEEYVYDNIIENDELVVVDKRKQEIDQLPLFSIWHQNQKTYYLYRNKKGTKSRLEYENISYELNQPGEFKIMDNYILKTGFENNDPAFTEIVKIGENEFIPLSEPIDNRTINGYLSKDRFLFRMGKDCCLAKIMPDELIVYRLPFTSDMRVNVGDECLVFEVLSKEEKIADYYLVTFED